MVKGLWVGLFFASVLYSSFMHAGEAFGENVPRSPVPVIKKITIDIPVTVGAQAQNVIVKKLTALEKQRFVYLDLSINFSLQGDGSRPFDVTQRGRPIGRDRVGRCYDPLLMGTGVTYAVKPLADYNHLLISVSTGARALFPYHDVSCEYSGNPSQARFRVRGFFYVLSNSIPTANHLQLRPFTPPYDVAIRALFVPR